MARPKRVLQPSNENEPVTRRAKLPAASKVVESNLNGHELPAKDNRKRKVATVAALIREPENLPKRTVATRKQKNVPEEPVQAKKSRETLPKKTTVVKKVKKRGRVAETAQVTETVKKTGLPIPRIPTLEKGKILAVGCGDVGQLGLGSDVMEKSRPAEIAAIVGEVVVDIAAGGMHSACLTSNGNVYTFGCNDDGTLGRLTEEEEDGFLPGKVELPERAVMISTGDTHTAALTETGAVYIWGNFRDSSGLMGLTVRGEKEPLPLRILPKVKVVGLASGGEHLACLGADGHLYTMGSAEQGQLGRIAPYFNNRGGRKGLDHILTPDVVRLARTRNGPASHQPEFDRVWAGVYCTFAREKHNGDIYGFGLNNYNQLGELPENPKQKTKGEDAMTKFMPTPLKSLAGRRWNMISGGMHHTLGLDEEGQVYAWGRKEYGRLGLGNVQTDQSVPVQVPHLRDIKCVHIGCGTTTSYAVSENGIMYSWGFGENQQLGHGNDEDAVVPTEVTSKSMKDRQVVKVLGGGQHTLILATPRETEEAT